MPEELCRYDPRRWCADPSDVLQAGYFGIIEYRMAREMWLLVHRGLSEREAHAAAKDSVQIGPHWRWLMARRCPLAVLSTDDDPPRELVGRARIADWMTSELDRRDIPPPPHLGRGTRC